MSTTKKTTKKKAKKVATRKVAKTKKKVVQKKVVKKKAVQKKVVKKVVLKEKQKPTHKRKTGVSKKEILVCIIGKKCFWTTDGQILSSLVDLNESFRKMDDKIFKHHVTKEKNDFADWVEYIIGDKVLAHSLRRSRKASTARILVTRRLKMYVY